MSRDRAKERERRARMIEWALDFDASLPYTKPIQDIPSGTPLTVLARCSSSKQRHALPGQVALLLQASHPHPIQNIHTYTGSAAQPSWFHFLAKILPHTSHIFIEHPDRLLRGRTYSILLGDLDPPTNEQIEALLNLLKKHGTTAVSLYPQEQDMQALRAKRGKDMLLRNKGIKALYKHGYTQRRIARECDIPGTTVRRILGYFR